MKEMVVCLTAFALSQESSATGVGVQGQTLKLPVNFLQLREQLHGWMERGKVRLNYWHTGEHGDSSSRKNEWPGT
jgi:hypothetical protein